MPLRFKPFQLEDYSRIACTPGAILGHQQGLGKTLAAFSIPIAKFGFTVTHNARGEKRILPKRPVLIVAPGGLHQQFADDAMALFHIEVTPLDSQATFLRLSTVNQDGTRSIPPGYYITSYTQLGLNGTDRIPEVLCDPETTSLEQIAKDWGITKEHVGRDFDENRKDGDAPWSHWSPGHQESKVRATAAGALASTLSSVGTVRHFQDYGAIKCVAAPSLSDLCSHTFAAVCVDEAVRIKGDEAIIALGVRQLQPEQRVVLTGTPIKNRVPDIFHLAHWACGSPEQATARFPYAPKDKEQFSEDFCITEENLTAAERARAEKKKQRRFKKLTPQVCNVHKLWKILAPIVLRRLKRDIGQQIVQKRVHIYRVPLGTAQAENYCAHLKWKPKDVKGKDAVGAQLQALRMVAACPGSGAVHTSTNYTPKAVAALTLIAEFLEQRKQTILFSPFLDALDGLGRYLREAGVNFVTLDGRLSEKARGRLANQFKDGVSAGIQVALAGTECMSEGYSFWRCSKAIVYAYPWALDKVLQAEDRIYRINSPEDVDVYRLVTEGTIDGRMESQIDEKNDAAELILDGKILGDQRQELNMAELLACAADEFIANKSKHVSEERLLQEWPALRNRLRLAAMRWSGAQPAAQPAPAMAAPALPVPIISIPTKSGAHPLPAWLIARRLAAAQAAARAGA